MNQSSAVLAEDRPAISDPAVGAPPIALKTRFGEMVVDPATTLRLPRGILGFSHLRDYALAALPEARFGRFEVLQSIEAPDVSFVVLPYETADALIKPEDVEEAFRALGVPPGGGAVMLVVSIRKAGETSEVSVNLRAPIVVDLRSRTAWQYVLSDPAYPVRHVL
jgi:flagellar assembly factor FliW